MLDWGNPGFDFWPIWDSVALNSFFTEIIIGPVGFRIAQR